MQVPWPSHLSSLLHSASSGCPRIGARRVDIGMVGLADAGRVAGVGVAAVVVGRVFARRAWCVQSAVDAAAVAVALVVDVAVHALVSARRALRRVVGDALALQAAVARGAVVERVTAARGAVGARLLHAGDRVGVAHADVALVVQAAAVGIGAADRPGVVVLGRHGSLGWRARIGAGVARRRRLDHLAVGRRIARRVDRHGRVHVDVGAHAGGRSAVVAAAGEGEQREQQQG